MIELKYKCHCMPEEVDLLVRERAATEDAPQWLEAAAIPAIADDHSSRSPACLSRTLDYLKIPTDDDVPIGNQRKQ